MKFELLPNEILVECFEYLNALDIFHSFDQLNYRFYTLIRNIRLYLHFEHVSRTIFNQFCKKILLNSDVKIHIYSLHLSNTDLYSQINTFISQFSFDEFPELQSLTLTSIEEDQVEKLNIILPLRSQLSVLHLIQPKNSITNILIKCPVSKLRILSVTDSYQHLELIDQISSITNLTMPKCYLDSLHKILKTVPMLKYLNCQNISQRKKFWNNSIEFKDYQCVHLKQLIMIEFRCKFEDFQMFIKHTPNLKSLIISIDYEREMIDAYRWEELIISSLFQLTSFQFKFKISHRKDDYNIFDKFEQFYTKFWQEEHHWLVEYILHDYSAEIYTIPYILNTYILTIDSIRYSNKLVNQFNTFDNVTDLIIDDQVLTKTFSHRFRFSNVVLLTLRSSTYTWNKNEDSILREYIESLRTIVNLSNIKHLGISNDHHMEMSFILLEILKEASNLSSLKIAPHILQSLLNNNDLQKYLNKMIRKLYISGYSQYIFSNLNRIEQFCQIFSNIVELTWEDCDSNDLSYLKNRLLKLSMIKIN
ncbi:unnamed protein product [Rotaria sp. Silwood1]|nr:unnamed protein product [Rotaria sp. Silwood1]CAF1616142.1 unnamed protein product [Rotaria sp. Silwood1]CAF4725523.1 unnamed protein product [Rotaria sp. Silwood1]